MRCRRGCGRKFAVGPDRAVFEVLFFPDRDGALERVNGEAASVEGGGAMRRADGNKDAGFPDFEAAEAMDDGDAVNGEFFVEMGGDFAHFGEGHRLVGLVVEIEGRATVRLIADKAVEGDDSAVFGRADLADKGGHVDGDAYQLADVVVGGRVHGEALAAADGRQEGDFVAGTEGRVPGSEFLIAGGDDRGTVFCEFGNAGGVEGEEMFNG